MRFKFFINNNNDGRTPFLYNVFVFMMCLILVLQTFYQPTHLTEKPDWKGTVIYGLGIVGMVCGVVGIFIAAPVLSFGLGIAGVSCAFVGATVAIWDTFDLDEGY